MNFWIGKIHTNVEDKLTYVHHCWRLGTRHKHSTEINSFLSCGWVSQQFLIFPKRERRKLFLHWMGYIKKLSRAMRWVEKRMKSFFSSLMKFSRQNLVFPWKPHRHRDVHENLINCYSFRVWFIIFKYRSDSSSIICSSSRAVFTIYQSSSNSFVWLKATRE